MCDQSSHGVPFLQMRSVGSHSTSGSEKEGIKERTGWESSLSGRAGERKKTYALIINVVPAYNY